MDIQRTQHWHELDQDLPLDQHSLYRKISKLLPAQPGRVLEVGCLDGRFLESLRVKDWEVAGIDIQPAEKSYIKEHDASLPFPYPRDYFDVVVAAEVIEHVVDTDNFLSNIRDVVKPGGLVVITTPNLLFGVNRLRMLVGKRPIFAYADFHVRMFVRDDLEDKISARFCITKVIGSHVLVGRRHGKWAEIFSRIGQHAPSLAAHFIVVARKA